MRICYDENSYIVMKWCVTLFRIENFFSRVIFDVLCAEIWKRNVNLTLFFIHKQMNKQKNKMLCINIICEYIAISNRIIDQNCYLWHNLSIIISSKHSSIDQTFQRILSEYVANLNNDFMSNFSKEKTIFATNKTKTLRNNRTHLMNLWKTIFEQQIKYYNENHIMKNFEFEKKTLLRDINIRTLRFKKNWSQTVEFFWNCQENKYANLRIWFIWTI